MKSQHRHDLQTNELGKFAEKAAAAAGGFFDVYGNRLMIGICVAALAASLVIYKVRKDHVDEAAAWRDLANARKAEDFAGVWELHPGTEAAQWARVHEGEYRLNEGVQLLFTNFESGTKELKLARDALQSVVDQKGAAAELRERALFGLARCLESNSDGSEGDAVKAYEALLREFPASVYKKDAESRVAALNSGGGQEFYAWFSKYQRPKPSERRPHDRIGDDDLGIPLDESPFDLDKSKPGDKEAEASAGAETPDPAPPEAVGEKPGVLEVPGPVRKSDEPRSGSQPP